MPSGTGSKVLATLPDVPYVIDPATFAALTEAQDQFLAQTIGDPGAKGEASFTLPRAGVLSKMRVTFVGQVVISASAAVNPGPRWPYGLLQRFQMGAGLGNNPWDCDGLGLAALHATDHPYVSASADEFPGTVGGDSTQLAAGTYPLYLTWDVPVAVDEVTLIASLFLQSASNYVNCTITREAEAQLFGGTPADATITGNFYVQLSRWKIPVDTQGRLVLPDISRVHVFNKIPVPLLGTGEQPIAVQRTAGVLQRLFLRAELTTTSFLSALPGTATTALIDRVALNYGMTETPKDFSPAGVLVTLNAEDYGAPLPYDTLVFDTLKRNPARDAILLQGVTDLQVKLYPDSGVTVPAGARVNLFEEILV